NHVGRSSMEVGVRVEAENLLTGKVVHVSSAHLVFVGIDEAGKPVALPALLADTDEEQRRMRAAEERRKRRLARRACARSELDERRQGGEAQAAEGGPSRARRLDFRPFGRFGDEIGSALPRTTGFR